LTHCKQKLAEIEHLYTETLKAQDKEWEEVSKRKQWTADVDSALKASDLVRLMVQLNDGMSLPTSLI
jgi:hypothetical protein